MAIWIGPEGWVDDFDIVFRDMLRVVLVFFVVAFFQGIVHGVDRSLANFVTLHGIVIGFLN